MSVDHADRCHRMGSNGRKSMLEKFDKQRQFDAFLDFFAALRPTS